MNIKNLRFRLFLIYILICIALTAASGTIIYLHPILMDSWEGFLILASPPFGGVLLLAFTGYWLSSFKPSETRLIESKEEVEKVHVKKEPPPEPEAETVLQESTEPSKEEMFKSGAIQMLSIFQREGRLVDFLQEDIEPYEDSEIGAAVREIHSRCRTALKETLRIEPVLEVPEGTEVEIDEYYDPTQVKLTGKIKGKPPFKGILRHPGWKIKEIQLSENKAQKDENIITPAEVEVV